MMVSLLMPSKHISPLRLALSSLLSITRRYETAIITKLRIMTTISAGCPAAALFLLSCPAPRIAIRITDATLFCFWRSPLHRQHSHDDFES